MKHDPTVFVIDDDDAVRDALSLSLSSAGYRVVCYANGENFLNDYNRDIPGCLLLDLCMPGMDGLAVQHELLQRHINLPIIFMTAYGSIRDSVSAVKAGALDFLEKPVSAAVLIERIRQALELDTQQRALQNGKAEIRARYERLSPREREIMAFIAEGKSSKQVAQLLGISPRTVDAHRARLMVKMRASSLAELGSLCAQCASTPPLSSPASPSPYGDALS